jgi:hypothetical protein
MVEQLKPGELVVVLTTNAGVSLVDGKKEIRDLDLRVEFQTSDTELCKVDFSSR